MYCQNRMVHTVQEGDSLYRLARQYHTTVTELKLGNPGVNPYKLRTAPGRQRKHREHGKQRKHREHR